MITLVLSIILAEILSRASSQNSNIDLYNSLPLSQGWQISGADPGDNLGSSVNFAGDINNDGIDDVIITGANTNTVYVIYGQQTAMAANIDLGSGLDISQGFQIFGANLGDNLGSSASYAGDFNNDGIDDIIIGANAAQSNTGEAYVIYGVDGGMSGDIDLSILDISQGFVIQGATPGDSLGASVSFAGDVNSDGIHDIIVGATGLSPPGQAIYTGAGAAYVIYGIDGGMSANIYLSTDLTSTQGFRIFGRVGAGQFGVSVNYAGDVNDDGVDDVIVGAYLADVQFVSAGIAAVIYGKPTAQAANIDLRNTLPISQGFQIIGSDTDDDLGHAVSAAGDFNADGIDDILVSAFQASPSGRSQAGSVYIIYGVANGMTNDIPLSASLSLSQGFRIDGDTGWHLGYSAGYAGDVNMDGIADVIIGSDKNSPEGRTYAGSAFVIYGQANGMIANIDLSTGLLLSEGFEVIGGNSNDQLGISVGTAGDFNNDGAADILIGATGAQSPLITGSGVAYVLYGVPTCSVTNCITCSGPTCVQCAAGYFLCAEDDQCYASDTYPSTTASNATNSVDTFTQSLGVVQGAATQSISLAASAVALVNFNNPLGLLFNALAGILMYMQFMSIAYPPKLQYLLDQTDASLVAIQYFTDVPEEIVNSMPQFALPGNFENNGFTSSFLVNFWPSLVTLLIICIAIVVVCVAEYFTRNCKFVNSKINKLKEMLRWNYLLDSFSGCYGDIALFSSFEFGTVRFGSFLEIISFSVCILVNIALLVASITMFTISKKLSQQKNLRKLEKLKEKLGSYQVVFENFKSTSFSQQSFVLISCLRLYLINTVLAYLFNYPLTQATLMNIQGLSFLVYLILKRPFKNTLDLITSIALELIFEVIHVCVFCFALTNQKNPDETISAIGLGDAIVGCIFAFLGVQSLYMIIQMVILIINLIKYMIKIIKQKCSTTTTKKPVKNLSERNLNVEQAIIDDAEDTSPGLAERGNGITPLQRAVVARRPGDQPIEPVHSPSQNRRIRPGVDPRFNILWDMIDRSREEHMNSPPPIVRRIPIAQKLNKNNSLYRSKQKNNNTRVKRK